MDYGGLWIELPELGSATFVAVTLEDCKFEAVESELVDPEFVELEWKLVLQLGRSMLDWQCQISGKLQL